MDRTVTGISYGVSGTTALGGMLSLNDIALLIGIVFTLLTFFISWFFHRRRHRLELEQHEWRRQQHLLKMELLKQSELATSGKLVNQLAGDPDDSDPHRGGEEAR
ncbi:HP1 family phage holin [Alishewanella sp. SMS8]|uniref:HP1 family phage holin n=1 Tax=Alishewanella sp. SMS8 TaxID=2994676 RepID=UPI002740A804|nr:HP1 family phage holin [Alishewanella sp. SMS8]MDP5459878.1 HP1 family phage holin [Alishewanella sp. SMS8]